jgi:hypothetical protein
MVLGKITILTQMLIIISLLTFCTGCMNKHYAFDFNSTSDAQCSYECENMMNDYHCWEASPSYQSSFTNQVKTSGICSCYIRSCRGK